MFEQRPRSTHANRSSAKALSRLADDRLPEDTNAIGGYWTRTNDPVIDLIGADRSPVAKKITFAGSIKWLENKPFDARDLARLITHRSQLPGADDSTPLLAVTRSGCTVRNILSLTPYGPPGGMDLNRPLRLRQAVRRPNRVGVADGRSHTATLRTCSLPSRASVAARYKMYICYIHYMTEPVVESMAEVRSHLADVIDRARRDEIPTVITRRGKEEAVLVDIDEYRRLRHLAEQSEDAWLNQLADEAEAEGTAGAVSLEEMAAQLRSSHA